MIKLHTLYRFSVIFFVYLFSQEDIENFKAEIEKRQLSEESEGQEQKASVPEAIKS